MTTRLAFALLFWLSVHGTAQGALYDRGGGLIYDSVLNVTWLQDASYAATELSDARVSEIVTAVNAASPSWLGGHVMTASDFYKSGSSYPGYMSWWGAMAWADQLSVYDGVRGVTWSDWRLPTVNPINGRTFNYDWRYDGSSDQGYYISAPATVYAGATGSELAYMYHNNLLGNEPYYNIDYSENQDAWSENPDWTGVVSPSFVDAATGQTRAFANLWSGWYWSGTEYAPLSGFAWFFFNSFGYQSSAAHDEGADLLGERLSAWPVRPGDVPLPAAGLLFASALAGLGWARRGR